MSVKTYLLRCSYCGFKLISDGSDAKNLIEIKTSPLMTKIPRFDEVEKKTKSPEFKNQKKRFKCPNCGRTIFPRKIKDEPSNPIGYQAGDEGPPV